MSAGEYKAQTDARGEFRIEGLKPGRYVLSAKKDGYAAVDPEPAMLFLAAGVPELNVTIKLAKLATLEGEVLDANRSPASGAAVYLFEEHSFAGQRRLSPASVAYTDTQGQYAMAEVRPGTYFLLAMPPREPAEPPVPAGQEEKRPGGQVATFYPSAPDLQAATPLTVLPGASLTGLRIEMRTEFLYAVSGRVTGMDEASLRKRNLMLRMVPTGYPGDQFLLPRIAGDGSFIASVAPGSYRVEAVSLENGILAKAEFTVGDRDVTGVELDSAVRTDVEGRIVTTKANPLPQQAKILLGSIGNGTTMDPVSDAGSLAHKGWSPRRYRAIL